MVTAETDIAPSGGGDGAPFTPAFVAGGPSSTDILDGLLPLTTEGMLTRECSTGASALTDGSVQVNYPTTATVCNHDGYATAGDMESVTYSLGGLYDIDSIVVYGGWNDAGRDAQHYDIQVSSDGGENYSLLTNYSNELGEEQGVVITPVAHRTEFTEDTLEFLAVDVSHIRFDFLGVENGYTGYTEIDVFGPIDCSLGDANYDCQIDIQDFYIIRDHFYTQPSAAGMDGDVNYDGFVDTKDYRLWKSVAPASLVRLAEYGIPEPATMTLGVIAFVGVISRRRASP